MVEADESLTYFSASQMELFSSKFLDSTIGQWTKLTPNPLSDTCNYSHGPVSFSSYRSGCPGTWLRKLFIYYLFARIDMTSIYYILAMIENNVKPFVF